MYKPKAIYAKPLISKSSYIKYMQHWKIVWLDFHKKKLKDEITVLDEILFKTGNEIGLLAQTYFKNKMVEIKRQGIFKDLKKTQELLSLAINAKNKEQYFDYRQELPKGWEWKYNTFFEPCFINKKGMYAYVDVLVRNKDNTFNLYEVKSTSKVKNEHIHDITFQSFVVADNNIKVKEYFITHLNTEYKLKRKSKLLGKDIFVNVQVNEEVLKYTDYKGKAKLGQRSWAIYYKFINSKLGCEYEKAVRDYNRIPRDKKKLVSLKSVLIKNNLSSKKEIINVISNNAENMRKKFYYMNKSQWFDYVCRHVSYLKELKEEPEAPLGSWVKSPYPSGYLTYLTKDLPIEHIYFLGMRKNQGVKNWHKEELQLEGIYLQTQIDRKTLNRYPFSETQLIEIRENQRAVRLLKKKKDKKMKVDKYGVWNNRQGFVEHYSKIEFPISFLDFETVSPVLPIVVGTSINQRMAYQYSLHVQRDKKYRNINHHEFFYDPTQKNKDPEKELIKHMIKSLPKKGSIVVYYQSFEKSVISGMAKRFPEFKEELMDIHNRIWDLFHPFDCRFHYNAKQKGSASIKVVYPLFQEKMGGSYKDLNINNGLKATVNYREALTGKKKFENEGDLDKFIQDNLAYCKLDTWAMVIIFNKTLERLKIPLFKKEGRNKMIKRYALQNTIEKATQLFKNLNKEIDYNQYEEEYKANYEMNINNLKEYFDKMDDKVRTYVKNTLKRNNIGLSETKIKEVRKTLVRIPKAKPIMNELIVNTVITNIKNLHKNLDEEKMNRNRFNSLVSKLDRLLRSDISPKQKREVKAKLKGWKYNYKNTDKYLLIAKKENRMIRPLIKV